MEENNNKIERDEIGNLIFKDYQGREIKADPNKFKTNEPLCKICKKDFRNCENEDARLEEERGGPIRTKEGFPDLLYYGYFLE